MIRWNFEKKVIFVMIIISVFVLIVSLSSMYVQVHIENGNVCGCAIPLYIFIPFLSSLGLFIGTLVYYFLRPVVEKKIKLEEIIPLFLDKGESMIVDILLKEGKITQASLLRRTGLSKVRVFRIVERLRKKGVVIKRPYGKTNVIEFSPEIKKIIQKAI